MNHSGIDDIVTDAFGLCYKAGRVTRQAEAEEAVGQSNESESSGSSGRTTAATCHARNPSYSSLQSLNADVRLAVLVLLLTSLLAGQQTRQTEVGLLVLKKSRSAVVCSGTRGA